MKELLELFKRWAKLLSTSGINSKKIVLDELEKLIENLEKGVDDNGTI
jgi:hypothetical protein